MVFLVLPVAALTLGGWALQPFGLKRDAVGVLARLCMGLVLCGLLILLTGGMALALAKWAIVVIAAGGLTYEVFLRKKRFPNRSASESSVLEGQRGFLFWLGLGAACAGTLLAIFPCLSPAVSLDVVSGPLASAKDYQSLGRLAPYDGAAVSSYASLAECLYSWAYVTGSEADVRLMSWFLAVFAVVAVYALASQLAGACAGAVAAGALAITPLFLNRAAAVSGDLLATGLLLASLAALLAWQKEHRLAWLVLAGIFAGTAWDGHGNTLVLCCGGVVLTVCLTTYDRVSSGVVFALAMAAALTPWLVTRLVSGAPLLIPSAGVQTAPETGVAAFLKYPWNVVMRPHWYGGWQSAPGGLMLILGIPGFIAGGRRVRWLGGIALACGIALYFVDRSHEAFVPLAAIVIAVAAVGACRLETLRPLIAVALTALFLQGLFVNGWTALAGEARGPAETVPRYEAIAWVNENLPQGSRLLTPEPYHYFFDMPTYRDMNAVGDLKGADNAGWREWLRAHDIGYLVFPETFVRTHRETYPPGAVDVLDQWRASGSVFTKIQVLRVPAEDGKSVEQVEIYEVRNGRGSAS